MIVANSYPATRTRQPSPPDFATTFGIIVKYHELWEPLVTLSNMANWTQFLRDYVTLFTIFLKNLELFLQHLNSENNGLVLFFTTIFWHWNCFLSLVTTDDKDGHGLKLGKTGPTLQVSMLCLQKSQRGNELPLYPICLFIHAFLEESLETPQTRFKHRWI